MHKNTKHHYINKTNYSLFHFRIFSNSSIRRRLRGWNESTFLCVSQRMGLTASITAITISYWVCLYSWNLHVNETICKCKVERYIYDKMSKLCNNTQNLYVINMLYTYITTAECNHYIQFVVD